MAKEFPLRLVIAAVDRATKPLREVNERIQKITAPVRKLNNSFRALSDEAGVPRLVKSFKGVGSAVGKVGKETLALGVKFAAMAAGASAALFAIVHGAVDAGDELATSSERVGMTADAYAQLQYAAKQADVEQEAFASSMDRFNKGLGEAKAGTGSMLAFLQKVSPALAAQVAGAQDTEHALSLMGRAFERVTDPGKRAALAAAVFGKSGAQMGVFLGKGSAEIARLRDEFFRLSGSQEKFAAGAGALDEEMNRAETAFLGARNAMAAELFPALTELAKAITDVVAGNREGLREWAQTTGAALSAWIKDGGLERLSAGLRDLGASAKSVVEFFGGIKGTLTAVGVVMAGPLISSVFSLVGALWKFNTAIFSTNSRIGMVLLPLLKKLAIGGFGALKSGVVAAWGAIAPFGAALGSAVLAAAPFVAAAAGVAAAGIVIYKNWDQLKELFTDFTGSGGLLATLKEMFSDINNLNPLGWLKTAGEFWGQTLGIGGGRAPAIGGTGPAPMPAGAPAGQAHVQVDFANLPPGARVKQVAANGTELDLSMGYSMAVP